MNLLENTNKQPSELRTKNWLRWMMMCVEHKKQIVKLNSLSRCWIHVSVTTVMCFYLYSCGGNYNRCWLRSRATAIAAFRSNKQVIFKTCTPFTDSCISKINNIQVDNAKDLDVVILIYNLIDYRGRQQQAIFSFPGDLTDLTYFSKKLYAFPG